MDRLDGLRALIQTIGAYNLRTIRNAPLAEISGSLGDLGTLLPLMIALAVQDSIDLSSTLVFSGLANIITGIVFGIPLPVQPMKAIAAIAISQKFSKDETAAAGLTVAIVVFLLSVTGLLRWLNRVVPLPVVKGIQVGAGLSLVISAGSNLILPLPWRSPLEDNKLLAVGAFLTLLSSKHVKRFPYALIMTLLAVVLAIFSTSSNVHAVQSPKSDLWHPVAFMPGRKAWATGAIDAALPQLPLTTLNSILAVTSLSATLFPTVPPTPSTTSIGLSVATWNLIGCWFGAMPICHGSGGLAGQYHFGARSGASIIILGTVKVALGLFAGNAIVPLLQNFPKSLLGVMVIAAGVELAKVGQGAGDTSDLWEQAERQSSGGSTAEETKVTIQKQGNDRYMVMLITVAGCLAFKNDALGFTAGMLWHWSLQISEWAAGYRGRRRAVQLGEAQQRGEADAARRGETENSLALGRTRVQGEYDRHFARMGPRFARGDSVCSACCGHADVLISSADIGHLQLMAEHIALQQTAIRCLQQAMLTGQLDLSNLTLAANSRLTGAIQALTHQYQRLSIAAPLRPGVQASREMARAQHDSQVTGPLPGPARRPRANARLAVVRAARPSTSGTAGPITRRLPSGPLPAP
ncbi:hypothetical protein LTR95_010680 [Oleoguttula sp. CCFEE 5521]